MPRRFTALLLAAGFVAAVGCASTGPHLSQTEARTSAAQPAPTLAEHAVATLPASETGEASDAEPTRAPKEDEADTVAVPIAGSKLVRGRSSVTVHAPLEKVREGVLGFADYASFMPHYKAAKILGRTKSGGRNVYMQIEALHGAITMWARVELPKPTVADDTETYETKFIEGNVKEFKAIWRLKRLDDARTQLELEVFLDPGMFMPASLLNDENVKGSANGVLAMRKHVEGR